MSNQSLKAVVVIVFLGVAGALIILLMTPHGVGITPDSTVYLDAAASLSRGAGLNVWSNAGELTPLTHYPPLYSSLLALLGKAGATLEVSARLLNAILFAITILLVGLIATT